MKETTHFGFKEVPVDEKTYRVREVFNSVARRYDLMNDLMSVGAPDSLRTGASVAFARCDDIAVRHGGSPVRDGVAAVPVPLLARQRTAR